MISQQLIDVLRPLRFRGKQRLLDGLAPNDGLRRAKVHGVWMDLDLSDRIQRSIFFGAYERKETGWVKSHLRSGDTFVDAGANVGYYTALAASCVQQNGRVFSVEPNPAVYQKLQRMIVQNSISHATALNAGLSDSPGILTLSVPPETHHNANATMVHVEGWQPVAVPVFTLDDCLKKYAIDRVDMLKMDVEGHEPRVLAGARNALAKKLIKAVLVEFNEYWLRESGSSSQKLWTMLVEAGFLHRGKANPVPDLEAGVTLLFELS
jgi:FkbM family methyltransferase